MQPLAAPILLGAFVFSVPTTVVAQEAEPVEEVAPAEEEEPAPAEEEVTPEETLTETPSEESTPAEEEVPVVTPTEESTPAEGEGNISQEAASTTDEAPVVEEEKAPTTACLGSSDETKESGASDWNTSEAGKTAETKENVKLGVKYTFPGRADVSVTFTCLPTDESKLDKLKIEEINAEDINLPEGVVAVSEYAYDITTGMDNGDFKYDLSLPKTNTPDTEVSYIEQSAEQVLASEITENELKSVDEGAVREDKDSIQVHELDHFTVFLVTANATLSSNSVGTPNNGWVSDNAYAVFDGDSDWAEYGFPDITIPVGATIDGIEVLVEGFATSSRDFEVALWNISDGADAYTSAQTANISGSDTTQTLGSATNLWGKTWTQADFADATFKVRVDADNDSDTASLDRIEVKVHYTASTKDLTITKVNNVSGAAVVNNPFTWTLTVTNVGTTAVTFNNQDILEDDLPSSSMTYADTTDLVVVTAGGVTGVIDCDINSSTLDCDDNSGGSTVVIPAGGSFSVDVVATPTSNGTFANPRSGGSNVCMVDPDTLIAEFNESNNNCADTVTATEFPYTETTMCHATGSTNNPYVEQSPATAGVLMGHVGNSHQNGKDIIPPVPFYLPNGQNWDAVGQAILRNHCVAQGGLKAVKVVDDQSTLTQWSFQLDNGAPIQANSNGEVDFGQVSLDQHTVTESGPNGYSLSSVTGCTQIPTTLSATATVEAGGTTICTFSNAVSKGSVTIIKDAQPNNSQDFTFTASGNGVTGVFTLDDDGDSQNGTSNTQSFQSLFPGQYSFSEESLVGWDLASLGCDNGNTSLGVKDGNMISFTLHPGEHVTCTFTNVQKPGTLHVKKVIENSAIGTQQFQDFSFQVNNGDPIVFDSVDGQNDIAVPADGTYSVTEAPAPGYVTSYDNCSDLTIPALGEETCTITNRINPVRIVATKIVCTNEADLPNYGPDPGGPNITASSAADWVETHKSCSLAPDWQFQWSYDGTAHQGDNVSQGGAGWTTSDFTDGSGKVEMEVPNPDNSSKIWVREVYQDGFIPFTFNLPGGENNANPVSAEMYCHTDVVNYDNWDWVGDPENGETYYCVAWNAPKTGKIIIEKQTDPDGSERQFGFTPSWGQGFSLADNQSATFDLPPGNYSVTEDVLADWELSEVTCDDQSPIDAISLQSGETVTCVFKNQEKARIIATKIVCTDETDLPNYGKEGGPDITATSASDWVSSHESCHLEEDWQFQWAYRSTDNPGDNTGASANPDWYTFGPTGIDGQASADVDLKSASSVWVREVWSENYIPYTYGQNEGDPNSNDVSAEMYCHTDVINYDNYDLIDTSDRALTYHCVAWNVAKAETPQLRLTKSVDVLDTQAPGNFVTYTLTVEAEENTVLDTEVTDLPPKGFDYVPGSAEATSSLGGSHDGPLELSHEYASPGVWSVGNLVPGEIVTLKYKAKISNAQDDGLYEDLAYARGSAQGGGDVLANNPDGFVGTQVAVATPGVDPIANIDTDNKKDIDTDTKRETRVLGASTGLPATGANGGILLLALALLIAGAGILLWSRRTSTRMLFLSLAFTGACLMGSNQALAAGPGLALEIEKPDTMVTTPNFKIGFVALDTEGRPVTYKCYETSYGSFQEDTLINGGSSGDCQVSVTVMPTDGNYSFYVTAEVAEEVPVVSETVNVTFDGTFPGTPYNFERDEATCDDKITFTTANDGQTVKVELYRSTAKDFVADTPTTTLDIGPNQNGYISTTPPDCDEDYWYALRALDAHGNASGFVADRAVNTDTIHKTKTKTTTVRQAGGGSGGGAIPVAGGGTGEDQGGIVEGATTEGQGGQGVLGEMTGDESLDQAALSSWAQNNKGSLFFILLIIGGLLYYFFYVRPKTALTKN